MKKTIATIALLALGVGTTPAFAQADGRMQEEIRASYKKLLKEQDKNKDGRLSLAECCVAFQDRAMGQKKCTDWDQNGDGFITEKEFVEQGMKVPK